MPSRSSPRETGSRASCAHGGIGRGPCWCVGEATAKAAEKAGFQPRTGPGDARALAQTLIDSGAPGPFAHIRGAHVTGDLAGRLRAAGLRVAEAVVYDQIAEDLSTEARSLLDGENPVVVPLSRPAARRGLSGRTAARHPSSWPR
ncbi:MAG: uroporphyrinogen-III synthase [Paracoccaceae bacterium]